MYKITRNWIPGETQIGFDFNKADHVEVNTYVMIENPNNVPGLYKKEGSGFYVGEEGGKLWWSIGSPKCGRFEYRVVDEKDTQVTLWVLPKYKVTIQKKLGLYVWNNIGYRDLEDVMLRVYLDNKHDYSEQDMVYATGKRQYLDELVTIGE